MFGAPFTVSPWYAFQQGRLMMTPDGPNKPVGSSAGDFQPYGGRLLATLMRCRMSSEWCGKWSYAGVGLKSLPGVVTDQPFRTGASLSIGEGKR